jgi:hypothetical protein
MRSRIGFIRVSAATTKSVLKKATRIAAALCAMSGQLKSLSRSPSLAEQLLGLDARGADDLRPFLGVIRDEFAEFRGRAWKHFRAQILKLGFELGIGKPRIDLAIELVDNVCRRIFWTPIPCQPKP